MYQLLELKKNISHLKHVFMHLLNFFNFLTHTRGAIYSGGRCSAKWRNYKAVRRNRLMQSWLTDLPAIQTGMLVLSAATFLSTGSEARPRPTAPTAAKLPRRYWELYLHSELLLSTVTFP